MRRIASWVIGLVIVLGTVNCLPVAAQSKKQAGRRAPLPAALDQEAALSVVREINREEYENATTDAKRLELAERLLEQASRTADDAAGRYVLLREAGRAALAAGDGPVAFRAVDAMAAEFQVDLLEMKAKVLIALAPKAKARARHEWIARQSLALAEEAVSREELAAAVRLGELATEEFRESGEWDAARKARSALEDTKRFSEAHKAAAAAEAVLRKTPSDPAANQPAANQTLGRFRCFFKADWKGGLPLLKQCDDATLKELAEKELRKTQTPDTQVEIGDAWWTLAEQESGTVRRHLRARAAYRYRQAVPKLSGLRRTKTQKRLEQIEAATTAEDERPSGQRTEPVKNEPRVVAVWRHMPVRGKARNITLYSNGRIGSPTGNAMWFLQGNVLVLVWPNRDAPGGKWVDRCVISPDGKTYAGRNQINHVIRGRLVSMGAP